MLPVWLWQLACVVRLAESEGTLILPQVESFHRLQEDDATTVTSDDSFFSAAEVSFFPLPSKDRPSENTVHSRPFKKPPPYSCIHLCTHTYRLCTEVFVFMCSC